MGGVQAGGGRGVTRRTHWSSSLGIYLPSPKTKFASYYDFGKKPIGNGTGNREQITGLRFFDSPTMNDQ